MNILIDIGHPAHVHLFRCFAKEMQNRGHQILFTARDKEFEIQLLKNYGFLYRTFGKHYKGRYKKLWGLVKFDAMMAGTIMQFKPDLLISHGSMYAAQAGWLTGKPHIALEDTGNMEQIRLYRPFSKVILTSDAFHKQLGRKQLAYHGYHELAYLHPKRFTPDSKVLDKLQVEPDEPYVIIRLVSWGATHDTGHSGLDEATCMDLVAQIGRHARIFISSEAPLNETLAPFRIPLPPEDIHHAMAFATLFVGEGATMASECAVLGTPAIYVSTIRAGTIDQQIAYGLLFQFRQSRGLAEKALELLAYKEIKTEWINKRDRMLKEKIDVTAFLSWFTENYPDSEAIMRRNPDTQWRFR